MIAKVGHTTRAYKFHGCFYCHLIEKRGVTTRYRGNKMSGSQPFFLRETTTCVGLVCIHGQESHTCHFFSATVYLQDHGFLRFRNSAAMVTWRNDFSLFCSPPQIATPLPWSSAQLCLKLVPMWTVPMASSARLFTTLWTAPRVALRQLLMWKIYWSSMEQTQPP